MPFLTLWVPMGQKNHVVPTAWQDEALARDGVSREVPCSALKGETAKWFIALCHHRPLTHPTTSPS